jgi:hypothetical protein
MVGRPKGEHHASVLAAAVQPVGRVWQHDTVLHNVTHVMPTSCFSCPRGQEHLTATMCFATASCPRRSVSQARTVRALSIVSAVVNVLLQMVDNNWRQSHWLQNVGNLRVNDKT